MAASRNSEYLRLAAAIALSCLLHGSVFILPTWTRGAAYEEGAKPAVNASPAVFSARLIALAPQESQAAQESPPPGVVTTVTDQPPAESPSTATEPIEKKDSTLGISIAPLAGPVFYAATQLTKRPRALRVAALDTAATKPYLVRGKLILQLWISDRGQVVDVIVESSELPDIFAETATEAFKNTRFHPGERYGFKVNSLMRIEVKYDDKRLPVLSVPQETSSLGKEN